jgi:hypothetical protein
MYPSLLVLHSWLRWFAVAGVLFVFLRALRGAMTGAPWTRSDTAWIKGTAHILTIQAMLGLLLYAVSPYIRALIADMGTTMQDRTSRLFAVEHAVVMVIVVALSHIGFAVSRKATTEKGRHVRVAIFFGIALLLTGYAIPWMRPMFRLGM